MLLAPGSNRFSKFQSTTGPLLPQFQLSQPPLTTMLNHPRIFSLAHVFYVCWLFSRAPISQQPALVREEDELIIRLAGCGLSTDRPSVVVGLSEGMDWIPDDGDGIRSASKQTNKQVPTHLYSVDRLAGGWW